MKQPVARSPPSTLRSDLVAVASQARDYVRASRAESTLAGYAASWSLFADWCAGHGLTSLPAADDTVALFVADMAQRYKPGTLNKLVSAIAFAHRAAGRPFDRTSFANVMAGVRRTHGVEQRQMAALPIELLRRVVAALPHGPQGVRDRALLLIGFSGALRRSELVGLDIGERAADGTGNIEFVPEGVRIKLFRSKTDQEGAGIVKGVPRNDAMCPAQALEEWLALAGIANGPVFRPIDKGGTIKAVRLTDRSVADIVKRSVRRAAVAAGLGDAEADVMAQKFAGHSLRAGFATSAAAANVTGERMAKHVGWKSAQMATRYVREAELFKNNPLRAIFDT